MEALNEMQKRQAIIYLQLEVDKFLEENVYPAEEDGVAHVRLTEAYLSNEENMAIIEYLQTGVVNPTFREELAVFIADPVSYLLEYGIL